MGTNPTRQSGSSEELAATSTEMSVGAEHGAQNSAEVAGSAQSVETSMSLITQMSAQMSSSIREVADSAESAAMATQAVDEAGTSGVDPVRR